MDKNKGKTVFLIRHGEAQGTGYVTDIERDITSKGIIQIRSTAKILYVKGVEPDILLSSTAKRAILSAKVLAESTGISKEKVIYEPGLYNATADKLIEILDSYLLLHNVIVLVGHNPGISEAASRLKNKNIVMSTAQLEEVTFEY
jgi:phosphohistidine phosphatase